eukprot:7377027-Prymnesium_polylepis.1
MRERDVRCGCRCLWRDNDRVPRALNEANKTCAAHRVGITGGSARQPPEHVDGALLADHARVRPRDLLALDDQARHRMSRLRLDAVPYDSVRVGRATVDCDRLAVVIPGEDL